MSGLFDFLGDLLGIADGLGEHEEYAFDTEDPTDLADGSSLPGDNYEADTMDSGHTGRTDHLYFAGDSNDTSTDPNSSSELKSGEGRYKPGVDSNGNEIAQGSLGPPYNPKTLQPVDPNDVTWPDPVSGSIGSG